jgi:hypothetical protein
MKREADPGKPAISSPLNERERQSGNFSRLIGGQPFQASDFSGQDSA